MSYRETDLERAQAAWERARAELRAAEAARDPARIAAARAALAAATTALRAAVARAGAAAKQLPPPCAAELRALREAGQHLSDVRAAKISDRAARKAYREAYERARDCLGSQRRPKLGRGWFGEVGELADELTIRQHFDNLYARLAALPAGARLGEIRRSLAAIKQAHPTFAYLERPADVGYAWIGQFGTILVLDATDGSVRYRDNTTFGKVTLGWQGGALQSARLAMLVVVPPATQGETGSPKEQLALYKKQFDVALGDARHLAARRALARTLGKAADIPALDRQLKQKRFAVATTGAAYRRAAEAVRTGAPMRPPRTAATFAAGPYVERIVRVAQRVPPDQRPAFVAKSFERLKRAAETHLIPFDAAVSPRTDGGVVVYGGLANRTVVVGPDGTVYRADGTNYARVPPSSAPPAYALLTPVGPPRP